VLSAIARKRIFGGERRTTFQQAAEENLLALSSDLGGQSSRQPPMTAQTVGMGHETPEVIVYNSEA
jgi:hypothetical protein